MKCLTILILLLVSSTSILSQRDIDLSDYEKCFDPILIPEISENLSGITYNYDDKKLYAVQNADESDQAFMYRLNFDGEIEVRYQLMGFNDTEGVTYLGNGQLAIVEERRLVIAYVDIPDSDNSFQIINYDSDQTIKVDILVSNENKGLEGIAYDKSSDIMYVCQEKDPVRIYSISNPESKLGSTINPSQLNVELDNMSDVSGLHYDSGSLFVLSHESNRVVEVDMSTLDIVSFINNLPHAPSINQPEGITFSSTKQMFIVSEANEFAKYNYTEELLGDVNLDGYTDVIDALFITQYDVTVRTNIVENQCDWNPIVPYQIYLQNGDVNSDGFVDVIDALFISQCDAFVPNVLCPNL